MSQREIQYLKEEVTNLKCQVLALQKSLETLWGQIYIYYAIFIGETTDTKLVSKEFFPTEDFDVNVAIVWNGLQLKYTNGIPDEGQYGLDFGLEEDTEVQIILNRSTEVDDRLEAWWNKKRIP